MQKLILIIILYLSICNIITAKKINILSLAEKTNFKSYKVGYLGEKPNNTIVTNREELLKVLPSYSNYIYDSYGKITNSTTDQVKNDYSESFFNENNLALVYVETTSGSITIKKVLIKKNENKVSVYFTLQKPSTGTCDMNGILIAVPVEKTITEIDKPSNDKINKNKFISKY